MCKEGAFLSSDPVNLKNIKSDTVSPYDTNMINDDTASNTAPISALRTAWYREGYWRSQVAAWRASGKKIEAYCQAQEIPLYQLYFWQRKF